jgi:hypothetical protein
VGRRPHQDPCEGLRLILRKTVQGLISAFSSATSNNLSVVILLPNRHSPAVSSPALLDPITVETFPTYLPVPFPLLAVAQVNAGAIGADFKRLSGCNRSAKHGGRSNGES